MICAHPNYDLRTFQPQASSPKSFSNVLIIVDSEINDLEEPTVAFPSLFCSLLKSHNTAVTAVNPCTCVPLLEVPDEEEDNGDDDPKPLKPTGPISPFAKKPATGGGGTSSSSSSSSSITAPSTSSSIISKSTLLLPYKLLPLATHDTCNAANGTPEESPILNNRSVLALRTIKFKSSLAVFASRTKKRKVSPNDISRDPITIALASGTNPITCLIKKSRGD
mmetsp:Transcript_8302/g.11426  ORF Transcript_8302/g.11426 Transcript_8302/m.11426 type:complete len:222 (-) Transcript_8302:1405-2070(-)